MATEQARLPSEAVARQLENATRRNRRGVESNEAQLFDLRNALERETQLHAGSPSRALSETLKRRDTLSLFDLEQALQSFALALAGQARERSPQTFGCLEPYGRDDPGQCGDSRQQDSLLSQPSPAGIEESLRTVAPTPRAGIEPGTQLRLDLGEVPISIEPLDLGGVLAVGLRAFSVLREARRIGDSELTRDVLQDLGRELGRRRQESTDRSQRAQLEGIAETIGVAPPSGYVLAVFVVEKEVAVEVCFLDFNDIAAVDSGVLV
jgi:hypothetical protein